MKCGVNNISLFYYSSFTFMLILQPIIHFPSNVGHPNLHFYKDYFKLFHYFSPALFFCLEGFHISQNHVSKGNCLNFFIHLLFSQYPNLVFWPNLYIQTNYKSCDLWVMDKNSPNLIQVSSKKRVRLKRCSREDHTLKRLDIKAV